MSTTTINRPEGTAAVAVRAAKGVDEMKGAADVRTKEGFLRGFGLNVARRGMLHSILERLDASNKYRDAHIYCEAFIAMGVSGGGRPRKEFYAAVANFTLSQSKIKRDEEDIKEAVGILPKNDSWISAEEEHKRHLSNRLYARFKAVMEEKASSYEAFEEVVRRIQQGEKGKIKIRPAESRLLEVVRPPLSH